MADSLEERFPDMKPITAVPPLGLVYGIGTTVYGGRDHDAQTGTYVKTHCFCLLFVPILAIGAYRVADAPNGGWYFVGKVPLSRFARFWNLILFGGIAAGVGLFFWLRHMGTPDYAAGKKLAEGDRLAEAKQVGKAARIYGEVAHGSVRSAEAAARVNGLLDGPAAAAPPEEAAEAFRVAVELSRRWGNKLPDLYERGVKLADALAPDRPGGAVLVLDALAPVAPDPARHAAKQTPLLEKLVAAEPANLDHAVRLAVVYEARKQLDKCEKVLAPHADKLGDSEGARVLGLVRFRQGKLEEAERLLSAYALVRLENLQGPAKRLHEAERALQNRVFDELKTGRAPGFDYERYKRCGRDEQDKMIAAYLFERVKDDDAVREARQAVIRDRHVVGAALDLGMVLLRRAQVLRDDERRDTLVKAEKTFLAVRGVTGRVDEVTLSLAEVNYWLGKQAEGKKQFERVMEERGHDPLLLLRVGEALRRVGENSWARRLAEDAHKRGTTAQIRESAADFRAILATDLDDQIKWLEKANLQVPEIKAALSTARGQKAVRDGNDAEGIRHFREALAEYSGLPANAANLNNESIVHVELYQVSGDREDFLRASRMMDKALAQLPGDSILLGNAAGFALRGAMQEVVGETLDMKTLRGLPGTQVLSYLYSDRAGRDRLAARLRDHPAVGGAVQKFEHLLILSPKYPVAPSMLSLVYATTQDLPALRRLEERIRRADLDLERINKETLENYQGKHADKQRSDRGVRLAQRRKSYEAAAKAGAATRAVAAAELANELTRADGLGLPFDADEAVRLAEEANKLAPSRGARSSLMAALLVRGGRALAKQEKGYAAWLAKARRALGHGYLLALALSEGGELQAAVLKNADVRRALDLMREEGKAFPDESNAWGWALLQAAHPEDAARLVKAAAGDEADRLLRSLRLKLGPLNASTVVTEYWALRMGGGEGDPRAVLRGAAARGVPLPFDGK
jgi:hypothetical protein